MTQLDTHEAAEDITPVKHATMTIEEFLENDVEGYEYVKGELIRMPAASLRHGEIGVNLIRYLDLHVRQNNLGRVYTLETSFKVGERVLKPDVAFVSTERLSRDKDKGSPVPPNLAIEVVSPTDIHSHVVGKTLAHSDAGTSVWIVEPVSQTVTVYKSQTNIKTLPREDTITGENVVPGFSCLVAQLFE